jgi:hypothetical protein
MIGIPLPPTVPGATGEGTPLITVLAVIAIALVAVVMLVAVIRHLSVRPIAASEPTTEPALLHAA